MEVVDQTPPPASRPTPRQLEAIALIARGMTYEQIAQEMGIGYWTVKDTLDQLRERIGARNTPHAIAVCVVHGWLAAVDGDLLAVPASEPALVAA